MPRHHASPGKPLPPIPAASTGKTLYSWPDRWYAYWTNRYPTSNTVTSFTPRWGAATGLNDGTRVVVSSGRVTALGHGSQRIPPDGYVSYFNGAGGDTLSRFSVGQEVSYRVVCRDSGSPAPWRASRRESGAALGSSPTAWSP